MNKEQIVEAIRTATNGTFRESNCITTCMGWVPRYDEKGRPLNADPNYIDSQIIIGDHTYGLTRHGWYAYIWENANFNNYMKVLNKKFDTLIEKVDLRPDYVKEYEEKQHK